MHFRAHVSLFIRINLAVALLLAGTLLAQAQESLFGTWKMNCGSRMEQSPFLKIIDDGQAQSALRLMSLPPGARITNPVAHEICVREGAAATS